PSSWSSSASSSAASWSRCICRSSSSAAWSDSFSLRDTPCRGALTAMISLLHDPFFAVAVFALLGLFVGSFLNVVIHRLPRMMEREWHAQAAELRGEEALEGERYNLATPPSGCPHC